MRLEFNIVLVDDDKDDSRRNSGVLKLKMQIESHILRKGFKPVVHFYKSSFDVNSLSSNDKKRIDLFLSDNNLSNNSRNEDLGGKDGGIELFLNLRQEYLCDFILYSRVNKISIVNKLVNDLNTYKNPNIFTRFSFIERSNVDFDELDEDEDQDIENWIYPILSIVDQIITRREELNNLRGIFAQVMSRVHHKMIERYRIPPSLNLADTIKYAFENKKITETDYIELLSLKNIRNGLLHNDEFLCPDKEVRCIGYKKVTFSSTSRRISECDELIYETDDFDVYRKRLYKLYDRFK